MHKHWTELPSAAIVRPEPSRPEFTKQVCPTCKNADFTVMKEWGYYERTGIGACRCGQKFVYYG